MPKKYLLILSSFLLAGCATNAVSTFYTPVLISSPDIATPYFEPSSPAPSIVRCEDIEETTENFAKDNYGMVGYSNFSSGAEPTVKQLEGKAKEVGADVVLFTSNYSHTETGTQAMVGYIPGTTTTTNSTAYLNSNSYGTVSASAYGPGGYAYGSGSYTGHETTSAYGTQTTTTDPQFYTYQVPYSRNVFAYQTSFLRKRKPDAFGAIFFSEVPEEIRQLNKSNSGMCIGATMNDGPAFRANLLSGDVVTRVGETPVSNKTEFDEAIRRYANQETVVTVLRGGERLNFMVNIGTPPMPTTP